jgi:hypothetical protein
VGALAGPVTECERTPGLACCRLPDLFVRALNLNAIPRRRRLGQVNAADGAWQLRRLADAGQACSGYLVEHDGLRMLVDVGYAVVPRLLERVTAGQVDTVLISHGPWEPAAQAAPGLVTAGSHDLLPNLPGSGRFTSGPCNPFPADDGADALPPVGRTGCRWTSWACSIARRGCGCGRAARAIPWGRDTAPGRWCRPCSEPRTYRLLRR